MRTVEELTAQLADVEQRAAKTDYDDDRGVDKGSLEAGRFRGYLDALRWVLGNTTAEEKKPFEVPEGDDPGRYTRPRVQGLGNKEAEVVVIDEQDLAEGRYRITWEGSDPLETSELKGLKSLIEKWAMGGVPDKTIALEAPRVLAEFIKRVEAVDDELTGSKPSLF